MKRTGHLFLALAMVALPWAAPADSKANFGSIEYVTPRAFLVSIGDRVFQANMATTIDGKTPGSELNLILLLGTLTPGQSVMYTLSDSIGETGLGVLDSISGHAP